MAKQKFELISKVVGKQIGDVVTLDPEAIPRVYRGRVRPIPTGAQGGADADQIIEAARAKAKAIVDEVTEQARLEAEKIAAAREAAKAEADQIIEAARAEAAEIIEAAKPVTPPPPPKK